MSNSTQRRKILREIPYGLYIITSRFKGNPVAAVVSFVTQTSLDPSLLMVALRNQSYIYQAIEQHGYFGLHFVDKDRQQMIADFFKYKNCDDQQINNYPYENSIYDTPLLNDSPMIIEAALRQVLPYGDHHPVVGEIVETYFRRDSEILTMKQTNWHYGG